MTDASARRQRAIFLVILILSTLPFWFVSVPPLNDFPGHMGRYHLQLELPSNPVLQQHWDLHWMLIGNLGVDLLMQVLGPVLGLERASWWIVVSVPPLMIWGLVRLARAYHGHVPTSVAAAFPLVLSFPFQTGLVNFWLATALAFHAAASVIDRPQSWGRSLPVGLSTILLWVCHIYGWAIFAVILASATIMDRNKGGFVRRCLSLWPLGLPLVLMLYQSYGQHAQAVTLSWFAWGHKLTSFLAVLRDQQERLDLASLVFVMMPLVVALVFGRQFRFDRRALLAAAFLLASVLLLPYQLFGSAWADARLWPILMMILAISFAARPAADRLWTVILPAAMVVLFLVRIAVDVAGYRAYDREYTRQLAVLDHIPQGARVAFFIDTPCDRTWRRHRLEHLDGLLIVRRDAFTNGQWEVPGAETVEPLAAKGTWANSDPSQLVRMRGCKFDMLPELARMTNKLPRERFDYVWIVGFDPAALPLYPWLEPIYTNDTSILYRIRP